MSQPDARVIAFLGVTLPAFGVNAAETSVVAGIFELAKFFYAESGIWGGIIGFSKVVQIPIID